MAVALRNFKQADLLEGMKVVFVLGPTGEPIMTAAPLGVVIVSQTCDVVLAHRPTVHVAPRVQLRDHDARDARDGKRPRYAHLPTIGECDFVDLDTLVTVSKLRIALLERRPGVLTDQEMRRFAGAVARKFGRFPFPDEVTPWLRPLESVVSSKARKGLSPEGQALDKVVELRIESSSGWGGAPYELVLCIVVQPGALPTFRDDEIPSPPATLVNWLGGEGGEGTRSSAEIAGRLSATVDPVERHWLWMALGDAWAARCRPPGDVSESVRDAVVDLVAEVIPADEFPLTRVRRSEILDLDHLSTPTPDQASSEKAG